MENYYSGKGKTYSINDKFFYALYLNIAQNNVNKILDDFFDKFKDEVKTSFTGYYRIKDIFPKEETSPEKIREYMRFFSRYLPFINPVYESSQYKELRRIIVSLLHRLDSFRNYFTHAYYEKDEKNYELNSILLDYTTETKERVISILNAEPYNIRNSDLKHLLKKEGRFDFTIGKEENFKNALNFFICLFLEKKYAMEFLKRQKGFKSEQTPDHKATLKTYTHFCAKMPRPVMNSNDRNIRFVLNGLNELKLCPKKLFYHLTEENREKCMVKSEIEIENEETGECRKEEKMIPFIRHKDSFPYFALKYLDDLNLLPDVQFHIRLGTELEKFHTHDNATEPVIRHKNKYIYGKMSEVLKDEQKEKYQKELESFNPSYAIDGENVKLKIMLNREMNKYQLVQLGIYELRNIIFCVLSGKSKAVNNFFKNYVSGFSCLATHISKNNYEHVSIDPTLEKEEQRKQNLHLKLLKKYKLELHQIPRNMRRVLLGEKTTDYKEKALKKLELINKESEREYYKLKDYFKEEENQEEIRERLNLKIGQLASNLTADIQFLLPEKYKLELYQYGDLQRKLAYYEEREMKNLLQRELDLSYFGNRDKGENFNDLSFTKKHPFLHFALAKKKNNPDLYHLAFNYYEAKREWIKNVTKKVEKQDLSNLKEVNDLLYYLKLGTSTDSKGRKLNFREKPEKDIKRVCSEYLAKDHALNIPRGLFNRLITPYYDKDSYKKRKEGEKYISPIKCIAEKYKNSQEFYNYKRLYYEEELTAEQINAKLPDLKKQKTKDDKSEENKALKKLSRYLKAEQKIRFYQSCDRLLWEMIKVYFKEKVTSEELHVDFEGLSLKDIYQPATNGKIENTLDEKLIDIKVKLGDKEEILKDKLVNYGKISRYRHDERLAGMFNYKREELSKTLEDSDEAYAFLGGLLDKFTNEQLELFKACENFEVAITGKYKNKIVEWTLDQREKHYVKTKKLLEESIKLGYINTTDDCNFMRLARNSAAHNKLHPSYIKRLKMILNHENYFSKAIELFNQTTKKIKA